MNPTKTQMHGSRRNQSFSSQAEGASKHAYFFRGSNEGGENRQD